MVRARKDSKGARRGVATILARERSIFKQHERQYSGMRVTLHPALTSRLSRYVGDTTIKHVEEVKSSVAEDRAIIGIIATPAAAQEVADKMVDAGIKVTLNYTGALLRVPNGVDIHRVYPMAQLMHTLYYLTDAGGEGRRYVPPSKRRPDPLDDPGPFGTAVSMESFERAVEQRKS